MRTAEHSIRILFVEDHQDTATILAKLLERQGHTVLVANSIATALQLAGRESFDLLICDIGLPDGNGCDVMRRLRESGTVVRGIALTAHGMLEDVRQSYAAGFDEHLTKPVTLEMLEQTICGVMSGQPTVPRPLAFAGDRDTRAIFPSTASEVRPPSI